MRAAAADVADVLQIPAFLCRQTDLLVAAAKTGRIVNIKKGQFLAPDDVKHAVAKVVDAGNPRVVVTERGTSFGYHNLVVDMRAFPMMRAQGVPVVFDVTHSLQLPGGGDGVTAGLAEYIEPLASAGVAAGVDGVFLEVHEEPSRAKSDAQNALRLDRLEPLLRRLQAIDAIAKQPGRPPWLTTAARSPPVATIEGRALARKVLETEAAAILALVDRLDERFDRAVQLLLRLQGPRHPDRHGQVGHHLPEDRRDAHQHRHRGVLPASRPKRSTAISASFRATMWSWRCRTAARPTSCCGCSRRSGGSARS